MTTQARERREGTMPPKAGRGKAAMHAEGRAKEPKKDAGDCCGTRDQGWVKPGCSRVASRED